MVQFCKSLSLFLPSTYLILSKSELCRSTFACSPVNRLLSTYGWSLNSNVLAILLTACLVTTRTCSSSLLNVNVSTSFGRITPFSHYFHIVTHDDHLMSVGVFLVSPTLPLPPVSSLMTVLFSTCPCRFRPLWNTSKLSSFKGPSNFVWEVQHVSGVEWSPSGTVLTLSNKEMWNWKFIRKSSLQLLGKGMWLLINCLKTVVLAKCCWYILTFSHRWVHGGDVDWLCIKNWRMCNCCVASSLTGEVIVESMPNSGEGIQRNCALGDKS